MARSTKAGVNPSKYSFAGQNLAREILMAYPQSAFPMANSATDEAYDWYRPKKRGIMPLDGFHASKSLRKFLRKNQDRLTIEINSDFTGTMAACAIRTDTWINQTIIEGFTLLHEHEVAHALTVHLDGERLGGIYGLALGGVFFGESMFSDATNGSKLALWALVTYLKELGFVLFDTQFLTDHLARLGGIEIDAEDYQNRLDHTLALDSGLIRTGNHPNIITRMIHSR